MQSGREPYNRDKHDACDETKVSNQQVELFVMLDQPVASLQTTLVLLGGIHFSVVQVFTSEDMFPRSEFKPDPRPNRPPRSDRMNMLD